MSLVLVQDQILPDVFNKDGSKFVECEFDSESVGEDQFQSNVVFLTAIVQKKEKTIKIPLVLKFEPFNVESRKFLNTNIQFYNEVLMYSEVLPFLNKKEIIDDTFPKFYHGVGTIGDSDSSVVVVEDLRPLGYKLTDERGFIDYEYLALGMSKLGRFHALSYAAKKESPEKFFKLAGRLKESSWTDDNAYQPMLSACFHRAMDPLINQGKHVEVLQRVLNRVDDSIMTFMLELVNPEEPMAVICHGDFCRNNILFKFDDGKPTDVKFFDIATARYSSPVVDIAFFLFLNSSREVREAQWDDLMVVYHRALSTAVPGTEVPSLEDIRMEMLRKAVYGFVHCSFFLPMMLYEKPVQCLDTVVEAEEDMGPMYTQRGGEEGTKLLSDMVEELVDRRCLTLGHKFI